MANQIHPTAVIGPGVELGDDNIIGPYATVYGPTMLGDGNWIGPHACIGTPGEMRGGAHPAGWDENPGGAGISIGSRNIIREFVTVQAPHEAKTVIGDDCYVMTKAHVPHDGVLEDGVTVSCGVLIGGHSIVGARANLGLNAVLHQRMVVGPGAMVGMAAVVTRPVPPYATAFGTPARVRGANVRGMERAGLATAVAEGLTKAYQNGTSLDTVAGAETLSAWYENAQRSVQH